MDTSHTASDDRMRPLLGPAGFMPKAIAIAGLAALAACTSAQSTMETSAEMMPRPQVVVVE